MKKEVTLEVSSIRGDTTVTAPAFCTISRAILPGHPTDTFVVEFDGGVLDSKRYPGVHLALGGKLVHVCMTFEALVSCLAFVGMKMTYDEPEKDIPADLVDANGEGLSQATIRAIEIREGFQVTRLELMGDAKVAEVTQDPIVGEPVPNTPRIIHCTYDESCPATIHSHSVLPGEDESKGEGGVSSEVRPPKTTGLDQ